MTNFFEYIKTNSSFVKLAFDDLLFAEYTCPIKEAKLPIWSDANYLAYVLSGRKIWMVDDVSHELKKGDAIFVGKGAHYIEQIFEKEFCLLIFFFPDEYVEEVLKLVDFRKTKTKTLAKPPKLIPLEVNEPLQIYFQSMASFFSQEKGPYKQLLDIKFKELLVQLLNYQNNPTLISFFDSVVSPPERRFRQMIESNLQFDIGIEEYAKMAGMSVSTFKRFFKNVFGSAPGQYIINSRLELASLQLKKTDKTIQEIAYESGFENPAHFTRMFNKKYKTSPSKYRENN